MDQFWLGFCPSQVTKYDLEKLKCTYRQLSKDAVLARDKYKEAVVKGELLIYSLICQQNDCYESILFLESNIWKSLGLKV